MKISSKIYRDEAGCLEYVVTVEDTGKQHWIARSRSRECQKDVGRLLRDDDLQQSEENEVDWIIKTMKRHGFIATGNAFDSNGDLILDPFVVKAITFEHVATQNKCKTNAKQMQQKRQSKEQRTMNNNNDPSPDDLMSFHTYEVKPKGIYRYRDKHGKWTAVTGETLGEIARRGIITPKTPIEIHDGSNVRTITAMFLEGLMFPKPKSGEDEGGGTLKTLSLSMIDGQPRWTDTIIDLDRIIMIKEYPTGDYPDTSFLQYSETHMLHVDVPLWQMRKIMNEHKKNPLKDFDTHGDSATVIGDIMGGNWKPPLTD